MNHKQSATDRGPHPRAPARALESSPAPRSSWPIVVGGCHRSGTSLVRRILDSHSRIHCGPEVKFFRDFFGDYFEDRLEHLRFMHSARSLLGEDELLAVFGRAFVEVHERAARHASKPRWADKNPENTLYTEACARILGDDWLLVHVVRNPLDTLASIADARFPLSVPAELDERIDLYTSYTEAGLRFDQEHPGRCYRLIYERLVAHPGQMVTELMEWLGETAEPQQLVFNDVEHQPGLEDPKVGRTRTVHAASVDRWRSVLTEEEAVHVWARTAALWNRIDPDSRHVVAPSPLPM